MPDPATPHGAIYVDLLAGRIDELEALRRLGELAEVKLQKWKLP